MKEEQSRESEIGSTGELAALLPRLAPGVDFLARRGMALPLLLFLSAHRPLAFVVGQALWLCSSVELLLPGSGLGDWATLLSHPESAPALERLLDEALAGGSSSPAEQPQ